MDTSLSLFEYSFDISWLGWLQWILARRLIITTCENLIIWDVFQLVFSCFNGYVLALTPTTSERMLTNNINQRHNKKNVYPPLNSLIFLCFLMTTKAWWNFYKSFNFLNLLHAMSSNCYHYLRIIYVVVQKRGINLISYV